MSALPAVSERLSIASPAGSLQVLLEEPPKIGARFAVVCHPHPLLGGTLDNKVVYSVARAFQAEGIATLRFNFRGVGTSSGVYDEGRGETDDAAAVAAFGAARWPGKELVLAGFSFGAYVALRLAQRLAVARLILVAPPVGRFDLDGLEAPKVPWLVVQGDADDVVDPKRVIAWATTLQPPPRLVVMPGVGHFFHGALTELKDAVVDAIRSG